MEPMANVHCWRHRRRWPAGNQAEPLAARLDGSASETDV
jgi:hypothetical protein